MAALPVTLEDEYTLASDDPGWRVAEPVDQQETCPERIQLVRWTRLRRWLVRRLTHDLIPVRSPRRRSYRDGQRLGVDRPDLVAGGDGPDLHRIGHDEREHAGRPAQRDGLPHVIDRHYV